MKRKNIKHWGLFITLQLITLSLFAQGPNNTGTYYQSANGLKGKALKTAMFKIIRTHKELSYKALWTAFKTTDMREDGKVWDMYSCTTNYRFGTDQAGSYKKEGDVYNREHSFPKSWFNEDRPMYTDLVHLVPSDGKVNGMRSNYPFGENKGEKYTSNKGFSKLGKCTILAIAALSLSPTIYTKETSPAFTSIWQQPTKIRSQIGVDQNFLKLPHTIPTNLTRTGK